jgi:hypothetical protein
VTPDGYSLVIADLGIYLDLTRLRRDKQETIGLLRVRVKFRGARTILADGLLSSADFNCSSLRARKERGKHLEDRARTDTNIDWFGILEELCVRVLEAEEVGEEERPLEKVSMSEEHDAEMDAGGLPLLRKHPTIWFGDGGSAKSYLALFAAVALVQAGERVLYCDWEFSGEDHRRRLHRIVGPIPDMPNLLYRRCDRPLNRDVGRIKSILARHRTSFLICDSLGFAADGTPESAEAATNYYKALRELGSIGSLHLAHISKAEEGDKKPFGSVFWANGARATWYMKRTDADPYSDAMTVGFFHRKSNVGRLRSDFGMKLEFVGTETRVFPTEITAHEELAAKLPIWQRMQGLLSEGPKSVAELAESLGAKPDSIRRLSNSHKGGFERTSDGRIALVSRAGQHRDNFS